MTKYIDFYFDFISPYSYLAIHKLKALKNCEEININYKPILLGGLHNLGGITAPAFNERKLKNMKFDCNLIAKKNNIPFIWNTKFPINSLYLMRGYLAINLFTGGWIVKDSQKFSINKILLSVPLIFTYLIGPLGLFIYWIIKIFHAKSINLHD